MQLELVVVSWTGRAFEKGEKFCGRFISFYYALTYRKVLKPCWSLFFVVIFETRGCDWSDSTIIGPVAVQIQATHYHWV